MNATALTATLSARRVFRVLLLVIFSLLAAHLLFVVGSAAIGHPMYYLPRLFHMGLEANVPSYLSALVLLLAALLLAVTTAVTRQRGSAGVWGWAILTIGFSVMSLDEAAQIHEGLFGKLLSQTQEGEAFGWHYSWYILYIPFVALLLAAYVPFLRALPRRFLWLFLASGALYVGGAIGFEILEAYLIGQGVSVIGVMMNIAFEETLELTGVALFIYSLLLYLGEAGAALHLHVAAEDRPVPIHR